VALVVIVVGFVAGSAAANRSSHPQDEQGFFRYVGDHVDGWGSSNSPHGPERDRMWAESHPALILAEGYRACDWLAEQPSAPDVDPSGRSEVNIVEGRYIRATQHAPIAQLYPMSRRVVVTGAWAYLCEYDRNVHTAPTSRYDD
jgi:hypothetical protein